MENCEIVDIKNDEIEISYRDPALLIHFETQHISLSAMFPKRIEFTGYQIESTGSERIEQLYLVMGWQDLEFFLTTRYIDCLKSIDYRVRYQGLAFGVSENQARCLYEFFGHPNPGAAVGGVFVPKQKGVVVCKQ